MAPTSLLSYNIRFERNQPRAILTFKWCWWFHGVAKTSLNAKFLSCPKLAPQRSPAQTGDKTNLSLSLSPVSVNITLPNFDVVSEWGKARTEFIETWKWDLGWVFQNGAQNSVQIMDTKSRIGGDIKARGSKNLLIFLVEEMIVFWEVPVINN